MIQQNEFVCRLCNSKIFKDVLCLPRVSRNTLNMLEEPQFKYEAAPISIQVLECKNCGLVQTVQVLDDEHYTDSFWSASHIKQMANHQKQQATNFVIKYGLQGKRIIDIGCGDGNYLDFIRQAGALAFGVEPAIKEAAIAAKEHNLTVFTCFVNRHFPAPQGPYDAFVARQVLEHIPDINDFLQGVRQSLTLNRSISGFESTFI